jgi:hypothetical protein
MITACIINEIRNEDIRRRQQMSSYITYVYYDFDNVAQLLFLFNYSSMNSLIPCIELCTVQRRCVCFIKMFYTILPECLVFSVE